jgi:predicted nucleotidyltransferase
MISYLFKTNNYRHEIIDGVEYIYVWNTLKMPYLPDITPATISDKYSREQIMEIDKTIMNCPLTHERFYDQYKKDCINIDVLYCDFSLMNIDEKIDFVDKMNDFHMPKKYLNKLREIVFEEVKIEYERRKKIIFDE